MSILQCIILYLFFQAYNWCSVRCLQPLHCKSKNNDRNISLIFPLTVVEYMISSTLCTEWRLFFEWNIYKAYFIFCSFRHTTGVQYAFAELEIPPIPPFYLSLFICGLMFLLTNRQVPWELELESRITTRLSGLLTRVGTRRSPCLLLQHQQLRTKRVHDVPNEWHPQQKRVRPGKGIPGYEAQVQSYLAMHGCCEYCEKLHRW